MARIIAFDIGDARVGVALSDPTQTIAAPLETYYRKKDMETDAAALAALAVKHGAAKIVCGLPISLSGEENVQTHKTREFCALLAEKSGIELELWDERLTSVFAERALIEGNVRREDRKGKIDKVAAALILQNYLGRTPKL